jgi:hypothetical protein
LGAAKDNTCALGREGGHLKHPNLGIHSKQNTEERRDNGTAAGHRLLIDYHHQGVDCTINSCDLAEGLLEAGASLGSNDVADRLKKLICGSELGFQRMEPASSASSAAGVEECRRVVIQEE